MRAIVFDLDDTLVLTEARVLVHRDGTVMSLTPAEFTQFDRLPGDVMDFSQFDDPALLRSGRLVVETAKILCEAANRGRQEVSIVTARGSAPVVRDFILDVLGVRVHSTLLHAVSAYPGATVPEKKAEAFRRMAAVGIRKFDYYEDCRRNVRAVQVACEGLGCSVRPHIVDVGPPVTIHRLDGRTPA